MLKLIKCLCTDYFNDHSKIIRSSPKFSVLQATEGRVEGWKDGCLLELIGLLLTLPFVRSVFKYTIGYST